MKEYPMYTATPLPWLPQLPVHWELLRNKNIFQETKEIVGDKADLYPLLSLTTKGIILRDTASGKGKFPKDFNTYKIVRQGDMAFCLFDIDETPRTVGLSNYDGMLTGAYTIFHVKNVNSRYVYYYYLALDNVKALRSLYSGLRKTINTGTFLGTKLPVPPREEQDQIVRFLDWKVSVINRLISVKKRQISAYKELRKATIDQGILHGFKKSEKKESGVNWLGKIPTMWEVMPLKRICRANASIADIVKAKDISELVTFLPMENVTETGEINCCIKREIAEVRTGFSSFAKGDVVVAKITPCFENGKGACLDNLDTDIGFGTTEFINLRPSNKILSRYLYMITMTRPFRKLGEEVMTGSAGQRRVSVDYIKNFVVGIPDIEEQRIILAEIDQRLAQIKKAIKIESKNIANLQEFKTRLISDVVTGRIDIRDVKIPSFDMVEEDIDEEISEDIVEANQKTEAE